MTKMSMIFTVKNILRLSINESLFGIGDTLTQEKNHKNG